MKTYSSNFRKRIIKRIRLILCMILILLSVAFSTKVQALEKYGEFYEIDNGYVIKILPETTYSDLKNNMEDETIRVTNQGRELNSDEYVGSGMTLTDGSKTYTTAVIADLDGNGQLTISDLIKMRLYSASLASVDEKYKRAADINHDGQITITDLVQVNLLVSKIKDRIAPRSFKPDVTLSKNAITVVGNTEDDMAGPVEYYFKLDDYEWVQNENKTDGRYTYKGINPKVQHTVRMKVKDSAGNEKKTEAIIVEAKTGNIEIIPSTTEWVNQDIFVTLQYTTNIENAKLMISLDGGTSFVEYIGAERISKNTKVVAQLRSQFDEIIEETELNITNIDKIDPKRFDIELTPGRRQIQVQASTEDENATYEYGKSGIKEYEYIIKAGIWQRSEKTEENSYTFASLTPLQLYTIKAIAYDNAGNSYVSEKVSTTNATYSLRIDANNGTYLGEKDFVGEYNSVIRLEKPTRDGYTFNGWELIGEGIVTDNSFKFGEGDATIKATWEPIVYTITYYLVDNVIASNPSTYTVETPSFILENPTKVGNTFAGWTGSNGMEPQKYVTISTGSTGNRVYTANWSLNKYIITYVDNIIYKETELDFGDPVEMPELTKRFRINYNTNGGNQLSTEDVYYEFLGWYEDTNHTNRAEFTTMPAQNKVLYAGWNSTSIELPTPEKMGYTFLGWYEDADLIFAVNSNYTPTKDVTLYAKWSANEYTLTFDANGGTVAPSSITANYETAITMPVAERSHTVIYNTNGGNEIDEETVYSEFLGWYTQIENGTRRKYNEMPAYNETLFAKWQAGKIELQTPEKEGYTFVGWYKDSDLTQRIYTQLEVSEDITVYAKWQANKYDAIYEYNGATGRNFETGKKVEYQSPYGELANPERKYTVSYNTNGGSNIAPEEVSYEFLGWYKGDNNITSQTVVDTPLSHILNARWQANSIRLGETSKNGYTFEGWYEDAGFVGTKYETGQNYEPKSNVTMYAKWDVITYTIDYNLNGGIDPINPDTYTVETDTIVLKNPVKEGYVFVGWVKQGETDAKYTEVIVNGSIGDRVYSAKWAERTDVEYTVEHQKQRVDGTYEIADIDYLTGTTNESVTPTTKNYVGFTSPSAETVAINANGSTKVVYKYTRNKYQFTIETGTGTDTTGSSSNGQYYYGEVIQLRLSALSGYKNARWICSNYSIGDFAGTNLSFEMPIGNITMTSIAQAESYEIQYSLNGGEAINPTKYTIEDTPLTLNNPTKEGYEFVGWTGSNGTTPSKSVVITETNYGDKSYTANWTELTGIPYKVIHQLQNITGSDYQTIEVENFSGSTGQSVTPATKNYTGFITPSTQTVVISADGQTKVTYKYERRKYQFTLGSTIGVTTSGSTPSGSYYYGTTIALEGQTTDGYNGLKWLSSDINKAENILSATGTFEMPDANITMTPAVSEEIYTITYNMGGGDLVEGQVNPYKYTLSDLAITLYNPERLGYEFIGWTGSNGTTPQKNVTIAVNSIGNKTYTANWEIVNYDILYNLNDGIDPGNPTSFNIETETFSLKIPEREGYKFVGWKKNSEIYSIYNITIPKGSVESRTYTAVWEERANINYTVEHHLQQIDGTYELTEIEYFAGATGQNVTPAVKSYVGFISPGNQTITVTADGTAKVIYKYERRKYQFTLGTATGVTTTGSTPSGNYYFGATINLNAQASAGYSNVTWESSNTSKVLNINSASGSFVMPDINITMTPKAILETYSITYSLNGGTLQYGITNPSTYTIEDLPITLYNPSKSGYQFIGWTGSNGTTPQNNVTILVNSTGNKTYMANWTASSGIPYTVIHQQQSFDGSYETVETENLTGTTGQNVTPTVKSYTGFTSPNTQTKTVSADGSTTFTYQYTRNKYQFTLDSATGVSTSGSTVSGRYYYGERIDLYAQASDGYNNVTWQSSNPTKVANINSASGNFTMPDANITMTPVASIEEYTITYNLNGGSLGVQNPSTYNVETASFTLYNPTKTGYEFVGWTGSNGTTPQTSVTVAKGSTGNKAFTANWTASSGIPYTVIHQQQQLDGTYLTVETENLTGSTGQSVTPETRTYAGFGSPNTETQALAANGSTTFTYKYVRNKYQFTLGTNEGVTTTGSTASGLYYYGATIALNAQAKDGYINAMWESSNQNKVASISSATGSFIMPDAEITMTPNATIIQYTITYNLDGGSVSSSNPTTYTVETPTITLNNPTKVGYTFAGWTGSNGSTPSTSVKITKGSTGNKSYLANWSGSSNTAYTVIHQQEQLDGTFVTYETENLIGTTGQSVTPAVKTYSGFTAPMTETATILSDGTTSIIYQYIRNKYQFTLGSATGVTTTGSTASGLYYYGATITLNAQANSGYDNPTWQSSNTSKVANISSATGSFNMPDCDITMTPVTSSLTYTISYSLNGGSVSSSNPTSYTSQTETFTLNNPTKTGYIFEGWTGSNGTTPQTTVTITKGTTGNLNYTANWLEARYSVTSGSNVTYYYQLQDAFDACASSGSVVTVLKDTVEEQYSIVEDKAISIELNNKTMDFTSTTNSPEIRVNNYALLTVSGPGTITGSSYSCIYNHGTLNVNGATIINKRTEDANGRAIMSYGNLYVSGESLVKSNNGSAIETLMMDDNNVTKIFSGEIYGYSEGIYITKSLNQDEYKGTVIIGDPNETFSTTSPVVIGERYASIYAPGDNTNLKFYNGILKSQSRLLYDDSGKYATFTADNVTLRSGYDIVTTQNGDYYETVLTIAGAQYTVIHRQQQLDGSYTEYETENLSGFIGQSVTPDVKSYAGFTAPSTQTKSIAGNGSTTFTYDYSRNKYQFTLGSGTGVSTSGSTASGQYYYGATITLTASATNGYNYPRWLSSNTSKVANIYNSSGSFTMPDCDITMTPIVNENTYNISFNANGGSGSMNTIYNVGITETITLPTCTFTPPVGSSFAGWGLSASGPARYSDGGTVTNLTAQNNITVYLYAIWEENTYTISYTLNGGRAVGNPTTYTAKTATFTLNNPTKDGYEFLGWTGSNGTTPETTVTITKGTTGNLNYTANWAEAYYSVTTGSTVTYHETLRNAFRAASDTGSVVKVLKNATEGSNDNGAYASISANSSSVTLDTNGKTIDLGDVTVNSKLNVSGTLTIEGNGTITGGLSSSIIVYGTLNVQNVTIKNTKNGLYGTPIEVDSGGTVNILEGAVVESVYADPIRGVDSDTTIVVKGGEVKGVGGIFSRGNIIIGDPTQEMSTTTPYISASDWYGVQSSANIYFYSGKIQGTEKKTIDGYMVPMDTGSTGTITYRDGCEPVTTSSGGVYTTVLSENNYSVTKGSTTTNYSKLSDALTAASTSSSSVITTLKNNTVNENITVPTSSSVILDTNGKTITFADNNYLEINSGKGLKISGGGTITTTLSSTLIRNNNGILNIENAKIINPTGVAISSSGFTYISGRNTLIKSSGGVGVAIYVTSNSVGDSYLNISTGTIEGSYTAIMTENGFSGNINLVCNEDGWYYEIIGHSYYAMYCSSGNINISSGVAFKGDRTTTVNGQTVCFYASSITTPYTSYRFSCSNYNGLYRSEIMGYTE